MNKILTVVIPTYNMEDYIERCLDSLVIREGLELLQVLVVNDGSQDRSSVIAHRYAERYPDSFFVLDKPNGNYGSCINASLPVATGKYIKILDADDYFDSSELIKTLKRLTTCESDAVLLNHSMITSAGKSEWIHKYWDNQLIVLDEECPTYFPMHSIIYRTELLREIGYRQTEGISYTDQEWIFYPIINATNMIYMDLNLYQYCMDREGQTMDPKVFAKGLPNLYIIFYRAFNYYKEKLLEVAPARKAYCYLQLLKQAETIYKQELVYNGTTGSQLRHFDMTIKDKDPDLYSKLGDLSFGFCKYVRRFRNRGCSVPKICKQTIGLQCRAQRCFAFFRNQLRKIK